MKLLEKLFTKPDKPKSEVKTKLVFDLETYTTYTEAKGLIPGHKRGHRWPYTLDGKTNTEIQRMGFRTAKNWMKEVPIDA